MKKKDDGTVKLLIKRLLHISFYTGLYLLLTGFIAMVIQGEREEFLPYFYAIVAIGFIPIIESYFLIFDRLLATKKGSALSLIYFDHLRQDNRKLKLILFLCIGICSGLNWKLPQINLSFFPFIFLTFAILLIIKEQLLEYRIQQGLFGTNPTEARALIKFIIKNSDDIDFTDSNGNLRRALMPETEPTSAEQTLPAFGEEVSA